MALGPWLTSDDRKAVENVLLEGDLMSGKRVAQLEERLAEYFGKRHCVAVSSGTAALECAFVATGEGHHIHPHGFVAILSAARAAKHPPECEFRGVRTDVLGVEVKPTRHVHDCAHRFDKGAAHAEVSCFSANVNKHVAAVGGFLVTDDSVVAATSRQYRNHGRDGGNEIFREGRNLRMGEMNAALALSQLARIEEIIAKREQVAKWYEEILGQPAQGSFLYPYFTELPQHNKLRRMSSFRLFNTATQRDNQTVLLEIWPNMTKDETAAICKTLNGCGSL